MISIKRILGVVHENLIDLQRQLKYGETKTSGINSIFRSKYGAIEFICAASLHKQQMTRNEMKWIVSVHIGPIVAPKNK